MKRILYYLPFLLGIAFYGFIVTIDSFASIHPFVWIALSMLLVSGVLLMNHKWWGCMPGIVVGLVLIYMGLQETGQIIKETPAGVIFCVYYSVLGVIAYYKSEKFC